jgi:L,D-transpeptidase YbiS
MRFPLRLLQRCLRTCGQQGVVPTRHIFGIESTSQRLVLWTRCAGPARPIWGRYLLEGEYRISTSRYGLGQRSGSHCTPAGLHRVAAKIGAGQPVGTSFRGRKPAGYIWDGEPQAPIPHRIFWLEGLTEGLNRGGDIDSYARYIYIHGVADEGTLGRPVSAGCIHMAAKDLIPLHDRLPSGTLVWIE